MKWQVINKNCEKQGAEYTALRNPMFHKRHIWDATTQIDKLVTVRQIRLEQLYCFASNTIHFQLIQKKTMIYHVEGFSVVYQHHITDSIPI